LSINKERCTAKKYGKIIKRDFTEGLPVPKTITVEYIVDRVTYRITEPIRYKTVVILHENFPLFRRRIPCMSDFKLRSPAVVSYNPDNPSEAYITDNVE